MPTRAAAMRPWASPSGVDASHGGALVLHRFDGSAPLPPRLRPPLRLDVRDTHTTPSQLPHLCLARSLAAEILFPCALTLLLPPLPSRSFDEWTDPADQALSGGRGMLVLPLPRSVDAGFPQTEFLLFPNFPSLNSRSYLPCCFSGSVRWRWRGRWWTLRRPR